MPVEDQPVAEDAELRGFPLSPAYVPDTIELDEHVPLYVPEHLEHHHLSEEDMPVEDQPAAEDAELHGFLADSDSMEDDTDADSIDYPDEPEDGEDPEQDPSEEHESEDGEAKEDEPFEDSDETEPFEEDETAATPTSPGVATIRIRDDIPEEVMPLRGRSVLTAPLPGCDIAESSVVAAARASRGQNDFVDAVVTGQSLVSSPGHKARTIARAADRAEDVGYVRALQASERRMMTSIEEVNLRVSYQRTTYETELQEIHQAYLRSEAQNRALLAQLETLKTHMTRMEWQHQRAEDDAVKQIMRIHVLEAKARIDTVEDTGSSC
ncbi:hypothetical protein Tco_1553217 [Tanacetum coccineum]